MRHMIHIQGSERVTGFDSSDVFRAGIKTENWPVQEGLLIRPHDETVVLGTQIDVRLAAAGISLGVDGEVTRYDTGSHLFIEGESGLVRVNVGIELDDGIDLNTTRVGYEVTVEPRKLHVRLAEVAVREFLKGAIPSFARAYSQSVSEYLQAESIAYPDSRPA